MLVYRMNTASGLFQMFGELVDVMVLSHAGDCMAAMHTEVPRDHTPHVAVEWWAQDHKGTRGSAGKCEEEEVYFITLAMEFGRNASGPAVDVFRRDRAEQNPEQAHKYAGAAVRLVVVTELLWVLCIAGSGVPSCIQCCACMPSRHACEEAGQGARGRRRRQKANLPLETVECC